ncbi:MAG: putative entry exclusion protein TrbK-alt, partial [Bradyrhizobium sp.]
LSTHNRADVSLMTMQKLERLPTVAAVVLVVLLLAACAIRLRDDEALTNTSASTEVTSDPLAAKLRKCRSVTYEQKDALSECRRAWAEKRRQFLGQKAPTPSESTPQAGSSLFAAPKDESRMPSGYPQTQQSGKE